MPMSYKQFLQALADAYRSTQDIAKDKDAYICIICDPIDRKHSDERIVSKAADIYWPAVEHHCERLRKYIYNLEQMSGEIFIRWARKRYPQYETHHQVRTAWLQEQADKEQEPS